LSDRNLVRSALEKGNAEPTDEEIGRWQRETVAELKRGDIVVESTPEREVALMFLKLDELSPMLVENFDWRFVVIPPDVGEVVLPDVGVTLYDPAPRFQSAGTGFMSSSESETALHLGPHLVLLLRPGAGRGAIFTATKEHVERINLRAVACSDRCLYGRSAEVVRGVLEAARADPERIALLRPRPQTIWIAEGEGEPKPGVMTFTGHSVQGTVTQQFEVSGEGIEEARRHRISFR
jgi:hypothetical protein